MNNILYFFYFIKTTNYKQLANKIEHITKETNQSKLKIVLNMIRVSLKFGASFKDYWMYKFYKYEDEQINEYVTTGRLYEFYSFMNDKKYIEFFRNKKKFNEVFRKYIGREYQFLNEVDNDKLKGWLEKRECIIAKPNYGVSGTGIEKIKLKNWPNIEELIQYLRTKKLELIEDCILQHANMSDINSSSVNSIRVVTVLNNNAIEIISAVLRIGINNYVDNFSAGGIAAPIDIESGVVYKPAVTKEENVAYEKHPVTGTPILGFVIPYWKEVKEMLTEASWIVPQIKTIGWDVAIIDSGPVIIEGNDNWNKDAFQIPYGEGRQYILNNLLQK